MTAVAVLIVGGIALGLQWQANRVNHEIFDISKKYQESTPKVISKKEDQTDGFNSEKMYSVELQGNFAKNGKTATHLSFSLRDRDGYAWAIVAYNSDISKPVWTDNPDIQN